MYAVYSSMARNGEIDSVAYVAVGHEIPAERVTVWNMFATEQEAAVYVKQCIEFWNVKGKHVHCIQTGEIFANASEAAKAHMLNYAQLNAHLNGKSGYQTIMGRCYELTMAPPTVKPAPERYRRNRIKCESDGKIYQTAKEAANACGVSPAAMSLHLNNPRRYPRCGGYVFTRIME